MVLFSRCSESAKPQETVQEDVKVNTDKRTGDEEGDGTKWGYDLYPERRGGKYKPSWSNIFFKGEGQESIDKMKCERKVYSCVKNSK
jgi:inner membrane protease ATP23